MRGLSSFGAKGQVQKGRNDVGQGKCGKEGKQGDEQNFIKGTADQLFKVGAERHRHTIGEFKMVDADAEERHQQKEGEGREKHQQRNKAGNVFALRNLGVIQGRGDQSHAGNAATVDLIDDLCDKAGAAVI